MITSNDFSFLITTAGNSRERLIAAYNSIRKQYPENEIVVVYDNTASHQINPEDANLKEIATDKRVYVSGGYNLALRECTKKCFVFVHDDTFIAPLFLENMIPHISETGFCNFTTVEPPVFGDQSTLQKPIKDFGRSTDTFVLEDFNKFATQHINALQETSTDSPFGGFFMAGMVDSILKIGGFDESFQPYFYEDSDLMIRMHLAGYTFTHALNSLVYHMGSLTSRESSDSNIAHQLTHKIFLKKWKVEFEYFKNYTMLQRIPYKKVLTKIVCTNCNDQTQQYLSAISEESPITVFVDGTKLTQEEFGYLQSLSYIIGNIDEPGSYEIGSLRIEYK